MRNDSTPYQRVEWQNMISDLLSASYHSQLFIEIEAHAGA